jgi:uncharacterized protein YjiS (DUF1127 family)
MGGVVPNVLRFKYAQRMENAMSKASAGSSTAHLFGFAFVANMLCTFGRHMRARRKSRHVVRFNDFMLKDIGLTRADVWAAHGDRLRRE